MPTEELVVFGKPMLRSVTGQQSYFLAGAGNLVSSGGGNLAAGEFAGQSVTTCLASVFLGKDAGAAVTSGVDHTFVGAGAGLAQTTGVGSTALGRLAGKSATTGQGWTAIGDTALEFNLVDNVVGLGYGAGRDQATGIGGVYLGTYAGGYSADADRTTVVGTEALGGLSYGDDNTIGGYRSGHILTGARNTAWGSESLRLATTGSGNSTFGFSAGSQITSGTDNTFVGRSAGSDALQVADVVNSIAIGASTYTTKSNQVILGNTSITETLLRGQVIVGAENTTSLARLDVQHTKNDVANPAGNVTITDLTASSAGAGGCLAFRGRYNSGGAITEAAAVQAQKSVSTSGNYNFDLVFHTRDNGGNNTEKLRLSNAGLILQKPLPVPAGGSTAVSIRMSAGDVGIYVGSGAPGISAAKGSIYLRTDGSGTSDRMYVNADGGSSWAAVITSI